MTNEEIQARANELSLKHQTKVHPLVFSTEGSDEQIIGYIKEPPRFVKLRVMDKGLTAPVSAASEIVDSYLLKEESDPRIYSESPDNDKYYIGATLEAYNMVTLAVNQFKKK
jgi:hypothetical protein